MMVKICGITNREDARAATENGASALGFIFFPGSPRAVSAEQAADIISSVGTPALKVGVFVNEPPEFMDGLAQRIGLDVAQLHGNEPSSNYPKSVAVWKAHRISPGTQIDEGDPAEALLLDGPDSGQKFDWSVAAGLKRRIIIAGGLHAGNVREAIERARPWGVDASSCLESTPGKKDHRKMIAFLRAALGVRP
jgi:phosphoribosylanthranilate isomerase